MCNPAAMLAMTAISTGLQIQQKQEQSDTMNKLADAQEKVINKATVDSYAQLNRQGVEESQNASIEGSKLHREMTTRVASARVSAAGAGVSGMSVDALLLDLSGKGLEAATTAETNYARGAASRADQAAELQNRNLGDKSRLQRGSGVNGLDVLGAGLKIGGAYAQYKKDTTPKTSTGTAGGNP